VTDPDRIARIEAFCSDIIEVGDDHWTHRDGSPVAPAEWGLFDEATDEDICAVIALHAAIFEALVDAVFTPELEAMAAEADRRTDEDEDGGDG